MPNKIVIALREIKQDKKVDLVPTEGVSKEEGIIYPTLDLKTQFAPELKEVELGQQVRLVIEGSIKAINDFVTKDVEGERKEEHSDRTIEIYRVGVSKIGEALKS